MIISRTYISRLTQLHASWTLRRQGIGRPVARRFPVLSALLLLVAYCFPFPANSVSWGAVEDRQGGTATFTWGWAVENDKTVICPYNECIIGVGPWDPRTTSDPNYIGGGINNPSALKAKVIVPNGATTTDAFNQWVAIYGISGSYRQLMWHDLLDTSQTCFGFQSFAGSGAGLRTGRLLPGTVCGVVPPNKLQCEVNLGTQIDLGVVSTGNVDALGSVNGSIVCSDVATAYAALINTPTLDGTLVGVSVNGVGLGTSARVIGTGATVPLRLEARVKGNFMNAGTHETSAILLFSYH